MAKKVTDKSKKVSKPRGAYKKTLAKAVVEAPQVVENNELGIATPAVEEIKPEVIEVIVEAKEVVEEKPAPGSIVAEPEVEKTGEARFQSWSDEYNSAEAPEEIVETAKAEEKSEVIEVIVEAPPVVDKKPEYNPLTSGFFNGEFLLECFNFIFPGAIIGFLKFVGNKKAKFLKAADLEYDDVQMERLGDTADKMAPVVFKIFPPALLVTIQIVAPMYFNVRRALRAIPEQPDEVKKVAKEVEK